MMPDVEIVGVTTEPVAEPPSNPLEGVEVRAYVMVEFVGPTIPAPFEVALARVPCVGEWLWAENDWWRVIRVLWGLPETPIKIMCEPAL